jgi:hypothetical protein
MFLILVQGLVSMRTWRFESSSGHKKKGDL